MALSSTAANLSVQDGSGAVSNVSSGAVIQYNPGATLNFSLQSTSGVGQWTLEFQCPSYAALHNLRYDWKPGMPTTFSVPMPDQAVAGSQDNNLRQGIQLESVVTDASGGAPVQSLYSFRTGAGANPTTIMARAVIPTALSAYTNSAGTLTENSNGAFATTDGLTIAVGDRVFLPPGIAAAAADVGVYQVTALGGAGALWSMTRVSQMPNGAVLATGTEIHVTEGTLFAGTQWALTTTGTVTVGTTTQAWFPRVVVQSVVLVAGTATIANVPIVSATKVGLGVVRTTANTSTATTGGYHPIGGFTAGALGTATFNIQAAVAAGTINNADVSTLALTIINQV